jgi:hypothetical protein
VWQAKRNQALWERTDGSTWVDSAVLKRDALGVGTIRGLGRKCGICWSGGVEALEGVGHWNCNENTQAELRVARMFHTSTISEDGYNTTQPNSRIAVVLPNKLPNGLKISGLFNKQPISNNHPRNTLPATSPTNPNPKITNTPGTMTRPNTRPHDTPPLLFPSTIVL